MAREFVMYAGRKFWLQSSGRYFQSGVKTDPERLLHRRIWIDNFGPIPDGLCIHHKDENWRNNDPDNLECKTGTEHMSEHAKARWKIPELAERMHKGRLAAIAKAPEWHASPEGIEWHRQNGINAWKNRKIGSAECIECKKEFDTPFPSRTFLCSKRCENLNAQKKYREDRVCVMCGAGFNTFKFGKVKCCSKSCGARMWRAQKKAATVASACAVLG